jgi:predicted DNA-binding protein YlxM (UPF0122 family)
MNILELNLEMKRRISLLSYSQLYAIARIYINKYAKKTQPSTVYNKLVDVKKGKVHEIGQTIAYLNRVIDATNYMELNPEIPGESHNKINEEGKLLKIANVLPKPMINRYDTDNRDERLKYILEKYKEGYSLKLIADSLGVSSSVIDYVIQKYKADLLANAVRNFINMDNPHRDYHDELKSAIEMFDFRTMMAKKD